MFTFGRLRMTHRVVAAPGIRALSEQKQERSGVDKVAAMMRLLGTAGQEQAGHDSLAHELSVSLIQLLSSFSW